MTIKIIKLENIRFVIDIVLIMNTIIFLLTDLDMKIYMAFNIFIMSIQHTYFNSILEDIEYREENEQTVAECIPLAKVSFCKEWENNVEIYLHNRELTKKTDFEHYKSRPILKLILNLYF